MKHTHTHSYIVILVWVFCTHGAATTTTAADSTLHRRRRHSYCCCRCCGVFVTHNLMTCMNERQKCNIIPYKKRSLFSLVCQRERSVASVQFAIDLYFDFILVAVLCCRILHTNTHAYNAQWLCCALALCVCVFVRARDFRRGWLASIERICVSAAKRRARESDSASVSFQLDQLSLIICVNFRTVCVFLKRISILTGLCRRTIKTSQSERVRIGSKQTMKIAFSQNDSIYRKRKNSFAPRTMQVCSCPKKQKRFVSWFRSLNSQMQFIRLFLHRILSF